VPFVLLGAFFANEVRAPVGQRVGLVWQIQSVILIAALLCDDCGRCSFSTVGAGPEVLCTGQRVEARPARAWLQAQAAA
jgi:hypothetical protein